MWRCMWNVKKYWVGELGLNRVDLADLTHIRPGTIGDIINGLRETISLQDLARICEVLQRDVGEVLVLVKDTEKKEGEERDNGILAEVKKVRAERSEKAAEKRMRDEEARKRDEDRRIQEAVNKILLEHGIDIDALDDRKP